MGRCMRLGILGREVTLGQGLPRGQFLLSFSTLSSNCGGGLRLTAFTFDGDDDCVGNGNEGDGEDDNRHSVFIM